MSLLSESKVLVDEMLRRFAIFMSPANSREEYCKLKCIGSVSFPPGSEGFWGPSGSADHQTNEKAFGVVRGFPLICFGNAFFTFGGYGIGNLKGIALLRLILLIGSLGES